MIQEAFYTNFRALRNVVVPLHRFTVIVGPNASGKTTILKGLHYLLDLVRTVNPETYFDGERHPVLLATHGGGGKTCVGIETQSGTISFEFRVPSSVSFETIFQQTRTPVDWQFSFKLKRHEASNWVNVNEDSEFLNELPESKLLKLEPSQLASPSNPSMYRPEIAEGGGGLASVLAVLHGKDHDTYQKLEQHLCKVVPSVRRIRFDRVPTAGFQLGGGFFGSGGFMGSPGMSTHVGEVGETLLFDTVSATGIPASCMSDGTLLVLGLLTVLYTGKRSQIILLDDLEHGLHPKAQREIVPLIRELLKTTPSLQIVATTHSPYLVDVLHSEEVRITSLTDDGAVRCSPLDKHPDFGRWKDEMSPGEFWSAVGEGWVSNQTTG